MKRREVLYSEHGEPMKVCPKCGVAKLLDEFCRNKTRADGLNVYCKQCKRQFDITNADQLADYKKKYYEANRDELIRKSSEHQSNNKASANARKKRYSDKNKELCNARIKSWYAANAETVKQRRRDRYLKCKAESANYCRTRQARKLNATPQWANHFFMKEAYALAALRTKMFGFKWHVDHIVPLQGDGASGFHCEANLSVVPAKWNLLKFNRLVDEIANGHSGTWLTVNI